MLESLARPTSTAQRTGRPDRGGGVSAGSLLSPSQLPVPLTFRPTLRSARVRHPALLRAASARRRGSRAREACPVALVGEGGEGGRMLLTRAVASDWGRCEGAQLSTERARVLKQPLASALGEWSVSLPSFEPRSRQNSATSTLPCFAPRRPTSYPQSTSWPAHSDCYFGIAIEQHANSEGDEPSRTLQPRPLASLCSCSGVLLPIRCQRASPALCRRATSNSAPSHPAACR